MAQQLKIITDPHLDDNVPATTLEQLQLATEKKAAAMAAALAGPQGLTSHAVKAISIAPDGSPIIAPTAARQPTAAEQQALREVSAALLPLSHHAIATQERIGPTPSPIMSFAGDENTGMKAPGLDAINGIMVPMPRPRPSGHDSFLSGDPGVTDWTVANQGGAGLRGPLNARSIVQASPPPTQSYGGGGGGVMVAPQQPSGAVMLASGKQSQVGAEGTAQDGRYQYQVQSDGSVKNLTTGRTTAPATR